MRKSLKPIAAAAVVAGALLGISSVYAQGQQTTPEQPRPPAAQGGMMQGGMPMMGMMQQMNDMMANCNRMMQAMSPQPAPTTPPQEKRG